MLCPEVQTLTTFDKNGSFIYLELRPCILLHTCCDEKGKTKEELRLKTEFWPTFLLSNFDKNLNELAAGPFQPPRSPLYLLEMPIFHTASVNGVFSH